MPRSNGIYSPPPGTGGTPQTVISSAMFNAWVADITADLNNPRPIIAGGTGSATSQGAIDAFFGAPRTIVDERLLFVDSADPTKRVRLDAGNVTAGQTRVLTMPDESLNLGDLLPKPGGTMSGLLTLSPSDDDPGGTASLNIPAGADTPDVQADGDIWADSNEDLRYRRGGADATVYDSVNLPRPAPGEMAAGTETEPRAMSAADVREGVAALAGEKVRLPSVATISGTAFDWPIDPEATEITISLDHVGLSGTNQIIVQLGTALGFITTGYDQNAFVFVGASTASLPSTAGFSVGGGAVARVANGVLSLNKVGSETWVGSYSGGLNSAAMVCAGGGSVDIGAPITQLRLTRSGTNTFASGQAGAEYRT